jgi:hypothetical protein
MNTVFSPRTRPVWCYSCTANSLSTLYQKLAQALRVCL